MINVTPGERDPDGRRATRTGADRSRTARGAGAGVPPGADGVTSVNVRTGMPRSKTLSRTCSCVLAVRGDCDTIEQPEAYLMRTATNVWRDFLRKEEKRMQRKRTMRTSKAICLRKTGLPKSWRADSLSLPFWQRWANCRNARVRFFVLCRVEGIRQKTVAKRLGVSVSAVEKHMIRAIAHLTSVLHKR